MNNTVGLLTFHYTTNYGAVLQAYALKKYLENNGYRVRVLDYRTKTEIEAMRPFSIRDFRNPLNYFKYLYVKNKHIEKITSFSQFIDEELCDISHPMTKEDLTAFQKECVAVIVGSDQIWNRYITKDDNTYLLDFVNDSKKIAYAASLGASADNEAHCQIISQSLKTFDSISVRETSGLSALGKYGITSHLCCDPTFLIDRKEWNDFAEKPFWINDNKFMFVYELEHNDNMNNISKRISLSNNCQCVYLSANNLRVPYDTQNTKYITSCSPREFIWLLMNSEYVFTNSFHGTILSINFHKNFTTFLLNQNSKVNNRIIDILALFGLSDRIYDFSEDTEYKTNLTYPNVAIDEFIIKGKDYLLDALK